MRVFASVPLPADVVTKLQALPRPNTPGVRWTTPSHWHVTLRFYGNIEEAAVGQLVEALERVRVEAPISARLGPSVQTIGRRVLHIPVSGLDVLVSAIDHVTAEYGEPPRDTFLGHMTLARNKRFTQALQNLCGTEVNAEWRVDSFNLMRSHTTSSGSQYEVLRVFTLQ